MQGTSGRIAECGNIANRELTKCVLAELTSPQLCKSQEGYSVAEGTRVSFPMLVDMNGMIQEQNDNQKAIEYTCMYHLKGT